MPIDITFKKYRKGGLIEVYGNFNDAIRKIIEIINSNIDGSNKILAFRFMIDGERGSRDIVVWRGPNFSVVAHNCDDSPEEVQIYKIFYEVFDVDKEGLEYDLTRLKINKIKYVKSEKPVEELVRLALLGSSGKEVKEEAENRKIQAPTDSRRLERREEEQEPRARVVSEVGGNSARGAIDVCLIALNKSVEKGCPLSSSDPLEVLERCGVYFNITGNSYLCILEDFDDCKYLVSVMDGPYTAVKCLSSREELEKLLGRDREKATLKIASRLREPEKTNVRRARPPLRA